MGNLIDFRLFPGQAHDLRGTVALIEGLPCGQLLEDRAFDAIWFRVALSATKIEAVLPPKSIRLFPAEFDKETYKWRHLIENLFQKIKEYRGIATHFCKTDTTYTSLISLTATVIRLK